MLDRAYLVVHVGAAGFTLTPALRDHAASAAASTRSAAAAAQRAR